MNIAIGTCGQSILAAAAFPRHEPAENRRFSVSSGRPNGELFVENGRDNTSRRTGGRYCAAFTSTQMPAPSNETVRPMLTVRLERTLLLQAGAVSGRAGTVKVTS